MPTLQLVASATPASRRLSLSSRHLVIDPTDLYVGLDAKGGVGIAARVSPDTKARLQHIVQSGKFDYKTESDIVRAAVEFLLSKVIAPRMDGGFVRDVEIASKIQAQNAKLKRVTNVVGLVEDSARTVRRMARQGAMQIAREVYEGTHEAVEGFEEPFRTLGLQMMAKDDSFDAVR